MRFHVEVASHYIVEAEDEDEACDRAEPGDEQLISCQSQVTNVWREDMDEDITYEEPTCENCKFSYTVEEDGVVLYDDCNNPTPLKAMPEIRPSKCCELHEFKV